MTKRTVAATIIEPKEVVEEKSKFDTVFLETYEASKIMFPFELDQINEFELEAEGAKESIQWEWNLNLHDGRRFYVSALVRESEDPNDTVAYVEQV